MRINPIDKLPCVVKVCCYVLFLLLKFARDGDSEQGCTYLGCCIFYSWGHMSNISVLFCSWELNKRQLQEFFESATHEHHISTHFLTIGNASNDVIVRARGPSFLRRNNSLELVTSTNPFFINLEKRTKSETSRFETSRVRGSLLPPNSRSPLLAGALVQVKQDKPLFRFEIFVFVLLDSCRTEQLVRRGGRCDHRGSDCVRCRAGRSLRSRPWNENTLAP